MTDNIPEKTDFEKVLQNWFREAEATGNPFVDIRADELHARVGDYPGPFHRMATCCEVMYESYLPSEDKILQFPPKGKGASMEIRYALPRKPVAPVKATSSSRTKTFTVKCEYCHGTGRDVRNLSAQYKSCPAEGCGTDKKGLHSLSGKPADYVPCKLCKGSGVNPQTEPANQLLGNLCEPCPNCSGTGIQKK
jgi:5-methylcytosine-specific restriction protein A